MAKKRGEKARKGKKGGKVPKAPKAPKAVRKKVTAKVALKALSAISKRKEGGKRKGERGRVTAKKRGGRRNAVVAAFFIIAFVVIVVAFLNKDWYSVAIAFIVMFLSLVFFKRRRKEKKKKESLRARARIAYTLYFVIWLAALPLAVLSIFRKEYVYAIAASCVMFFCSFMTAIVHKNLNKKEVVAAMKKLLQRKSKRYETNFDRLLELLKKYKKVKISHVSKGFGVSKEKVMEWSEILESHNFLKVRYPPFSEAELIIKGEGVKKGGTK